MSRRDQRTLRDKRAEVGLRRIVDDLEGRKAEAVLLDEFVPTPRPTRLARAVQRVLGAPPVDDPVHGRRALTLARVTEALDHGTPPDQDGTPTHSDGQR